jgi:hypothetical protein
MNYLFFSNKKETIKESEEYIIYKDDQFMIQLFSNKDISIEKFNNWSKNRPPDMNRVNEITEFLQLNNRQIIDGIIYVWNNNNKYLIYDGIHRFQALLKIPTEIYFLVSIYNTPRENDIIQHFMSLNKSVNIPTIYLGKDDNYHKKNVCEAVAKELSLAYPKFVSTSRNPYYYNFNRDNFIEFLSTLKIDFEYPKADKIIEKILKELNNYSKEKNSREENLPQKCHNYNFYLFILDNSFIKKTIEEKFDFYKNDF